MPLPVRPFAYPQPLTMDVIDYNKLLDSYNKAPSTIQSAYKIVLDSKIDSLLSTSATYYSTLNVNIMNLKVGS